MPDGFYAGRMEACLSLRNTILFPVKRMLSGAQIVKMRLCVGSYLVDGGVRRLVYTHRGAMYSRRVVLGPRASG